MPADGWLWRRGTDEFIAGVGYRDGEPDGETLAERLRGGLPPLKVASDGTVF